MLVFPLPPADFMKKRSVKFKVGTSVILGTGGRGKREEGKHSKLFTTREKGQRAEGRGQKAKGREQKAQDFSVFNLHTQNSISSTSLSSSDSFTFHLIKSISFPNEELFSSSKHKQLFLSETT